MGELRKDPITGRWVIISTERIKRPSDFSITKTATNPKGCPFCEGNESKTPPEIFAFRSPHSQPNQIGWQVRVVPNKFPALRIEGNLEKKGVGMYDMMNGVGAHEVVIETPYHDKGMYQYTVEEMSKVIQSYKIRLSDLKNDHRFKYIILFKNEGSLAGASLTHPHSQIIAMPVTPKRVREELLGSQEYYQYKDRCVYCDIIREEQNQKVRIVYENAGFISFCPFASRFPFEIWVIPKRHNPDYENITPEEVPILSDILITTLGKLAVALNNPQYNFVVHTGPIRWMRKGYWTTIDLDFHWHIEIMPRLTRIAGFEWGTGFYINPTIPEEAAKFMQEISI